MNPKTEPRVALIEACRAMVEQGLVQGTSGNASVRNGDRMLITPSAVGYDELEPELIVAIDLSDPDKRCGDLAPSTEWRIHLALLNNRPEFSAILHAHPVHATALSMLRQPLPAAHYMIAAFGGDDVRCADYAIFGGSELARHVVTAMSDRSACLMANHGIIAAGTTLQDALWRACELELLAQQYLTAKSVGEPVILSRSEIDEALSAFSGYGPSDS